MAGAAVVAEILRVIVVALLGIGIGIDRLATVAVAVPAFPQRLPLVAPVSVFALAAF
jgi:hypothetical protein